MKMGFKMGLSRPLCGLSKTYSAEGGGCHARSKWVGLGLCQQGSPLYFTDQISNVLSDGLPLGI